MRDDRERLRHIFEAIERIEKYAGRGEQAFRTDELIQVWMLQNLQVIGEAARACSTAFRERYSVLSWSEIIGMRNVLVHEYFDIDLDIVWQVVSTDIPKLKQALEALLNELEASR